MKNTAWNEAESFDALWDQYGEKVYNLAIRLAGSAKEGWLLARAAFLMVRQNLSSMEGHTPTHWLYEITIQTWYAPYKEQDTFWKRWFMKKKFRWELSLPDSVESSLTFLADRQEAILQLLNTLDYPERMIAVLRLADGFSVSEICQMTPFREGQVNKLTRKATDLLSKTLAGAGIAFSNSPDARTAAVSSLLRAWKPLKSPPALKADIVQKRVFQKRMLQEHIPDRYSLKGIVWVWAVVLLVLISVLGYFFTAGRHMRDSIDEQLMSQNAAEHPVRPVGH